MEEDIYSLLGIEESKAGINYGVFAKYLLIAVFISFISALSVFSSEKELRLQIFAENLLILSCVFIFTVSPLTALIRHESNIVFKFIAWLPNILTALPFSIFMISAGSWGAHKHPIIHGVTSNVSYDIPSEIYAYLPILFISIYVYLFVSKKIKFVEIMLSLIIYLLSYLVIYGFAIALSGLV